MIKTIWHKVVFTWYSIKVSIICWWAGFDMDEVFFEGDE